MEGLVLDLCANDYAQTGAWASRTAGGPDASVPEGVAFDSAEQAFAFAEGGDVISVPLPTSPHFLREVSFSCWVKVPQELSNFAWILCQHPDHGWSRAVALNDYRLGHVSITTSGYWDSGLGRAPTGRWLHVAGVWRQNGDSFAYIDGRRSAAMTANNGRSADPGERLHIGGRRAGDQVHNASIFIARVSVFDRALSDAEVVQLHLAGRKGPLTPASAGQTSLARKPAPPLTAALLAETAPAAGFDVAGPLSPLPSLLPAAVSGLLTCGPGAPPPMQADTAEAAPRTPAPVWDEATRRFWCTTDVNAYDLPEASEWQRSFQDMLHNVTNTLLPQKKPRSLQRNASEAAEPRIGASARPGRRLARFPSDPDKRSVRAAHTTALRKMENKPGIEAIVQGRRLVFFRFSGRIFAADAACPHQGANLCEGEVGDIEDMVEGRRFYIRCPVHKFQFDLGSGSVIEGDCPALRTYRVRVSDVDEVRKVAKIEVGFESLAPFYFVGGDGPDAVDF